MLLQIHYINLTIKQAKQHFECFEDFTIDHKQLERVVESFKYSNPDATIFIKEIRKIHKKNFIIISSKYQGEKLNYYTLNLMTEINGHYIQLEFVCYAENCTNFIANAKKSINTIKIE